MTPTQSIIVYRNPIEAAFWEGGMALPIFSFILISLLLIVSSNSLLDKLFTTMKWRKWGGKYVYSQYALIASSLVASFFITAKVVG